MMKKGAAVEMKSETMTKITKWVLDFMFLAGIVAVATLPFTLKLAGAYYMEELAEHYWFMLAILTASGLSGLLIIRELRQMMRTVVAQNCFVYENVLSLKRMGIISFLIAVLYCIKLFVVPTPATFVIVLTFFIAGLFSEVLACVFREAVQYKEENDLTV